MAAWCLGSFEEEVTKKQFDKIVGLLDDKFLQVRTSACATLGRWSDN
jgi:hypothetical protein